SGILSGSLVACSREEPPPLPEPIARPKAAAERKPREQAKAEVPPPAVKQPEKPEPASSPLQQPFTVRVGSEDDNGDAPLTVKLDVQINQGDAAAPFTVLWDFGDGSPFGSGTEISHVYTFPGEFRASAIVRDKNGKIAQDYADVTVEEPWEQAR